MIAEPLQIIWDHISKYADYLVRYHDFRGPGSTFSGLPGERGPPGTPGVSGPIGNRDGCPEFDGINLSLVCAHVVVNNHHCHAKV